MFEPSLSTSKTLIDFKNLEGNFKHNEHFFYYRRPIELLYSKMKQPQRAIEYAEQQKENNSSKTLVLNYMITKITEESSIKKEKGIQAIDYCIKHYTKNTSFSLEEAETLMRKLKP